MVPFCLLLRFFFVSSLFVHFHHSLVRMVKSSQGSGVVRGQSGAFVFLDAGHCVASLGQCFAPSAPHLQENRSAGRH